jgi:hypothetical protein
MRADQRHDPEGQRGQDEEREDETVVRTVEHTTRLPRRA